MNLTIEELKGVKEQVFVKRYPIEKILSEQHPDKNIAIVRGYDKFSNEKYTNMAFFTSEQARKYIAEIPSNGCMNFSDTFHIIISSIEQLEMGRILDKGYQLDKIDKVLIYNSLQAALSLLN